MYVSQKNRQGGRSDDDKTCRHAAPCLVCVCMTGIVRLSLYVLIGERLVAKRDQSRVGQRCVRVQGGGRGEDRPSCRAGKT